MNRRHQQCGVMGKTAAYNAKISNVPQFMSRCSSSDHSPWKSSWKAAGDGPNSQAPAPAFEIQKKLQTPDPAFPVLHIAVFWGFHRQIKNLSLFSLSTLFFPLYVTCTVKSKPILKRDICSNTGNHQKVHVDAMACS